MVKLYKQQLNLIDYPLIPPSSNTWGRQIKATIPQGPYIVHTMYGTAHSNWHVLCLITTRDTWNATTRDTWKTLEQSGLTSSTYLLLFLIVIISNNRRRRYPATLTFLTTDFFLTGMRGLSVLLLFTNYDHKQHYCYL